VGAKPLNVLTQFLVESAVLSTLGGVLGILLGSFVARALASKFGWPFSNRMDMVLLSFGFSLLVGVGFGLYPARKAADLDPIEALRYE
jgi:putative ABC transport system permease protein